MKSETMKLKKEKEERVEKVIYESLSQLDDRGLNKIINYDGKMLLDGGIYEKPDGFTKKVG